MEVRARCPFPFALKCFFRMTKSLQSVLERQFNLLYYLHLPITEQEKLESFELNWTYQKLVEVKEAENTSDDKEVF